MATLWGGFCLWQGKKAHKTYTSISNTTLRVEILGKKKSIVTNFSIFFVLKEIHQN